MVCDAVGGPLGVLTWVSMLWQVSCRQSSLFHPWQSLNMSTVCHVKKAWCSFNKGGDDGGAVENGSMMELLLDISSRLARMEDKVEHICGACEGPDG